MSSNSEILERYVLLAYGGGSGGQQLQAQQPQQQQDAITSQQAVAEATANLNLVRSSPDGGASMCLELLIHSRTDEAVFFALTTLQRCLSFPSSFPPDGGVGGRQGDGGQQPTGASSTAATSPPSLPDLSTRAQIREALIRRLLDAAAAARGGGPAMPPYLRTKISVVLALLIQRDFVDAWPTAFDDVAGWLLLSAPPPPPAGGNGGILGGGGDATGTLLLNDVLLRTYGAAVDEVASQRPDRSREEIIVNARIRDVMRGFDVSSSSGGGGGDAEGTRNGGGGTVTTGMASNSASADAPGGSSCATSRIVGTTLEIFRRYYRRGPSSDNDDAEEKLAALALSTLKKLVGWVDLSLVCNPQVLPVLFDCSFLGPPVVGGAVSSAVHAGDIGTTTAVAVEAVDCLLEIIGKGMDEERKVALLTEMDVLGHLSASLEAPGPPPALTGGDYATNARATSSLQRAMQEDEDLALKMAELVNVVGMEVLPYWDAAMYPGDTKGRATDGNGERMADSEDDDAASDLRAAELKQMASELLHRLMPPFFYFFAHEDIDVAGTVLPIASRLTVTLGKELKRQQQPQQQALSQRDCFAVAEHAPRMLHVMHRQMKYPIDFAYDYTDDGDAEEHIFRSSDLRKLYVKFVRTIPEESLQFLCGVLSELSTPLSSCSTPDAEAALRLIFHYCEGVRLPSGGSSVVTRNETFRDIVLALHRSDIAAHPHREVVSAYYDIVVRYASILRVHPELLPGVLESMSGPRGLQHPHPRVRSRSAYLLLKLVKSLSAVMRPYVETAVGGIQGLLSNQSAFPMEPDDSLYLFETVGLLLGTTGLDVPDQQRYLTAVITPHIRYIEETLRSPNLHRDPEHYGALLSQSVAAVACLSKGFDPRTVPTEVKMVLMETISACLAVLQALPGSEQVRNKVMNLCQRMILCLGEGILPSIPPFLELLVDKCTSDDVLDVAQLLNQICKKFKSGAAPAVDAAVFPFLRKCHDLIASTNEVVPKSGDNERNGVVDNALLPPHLLTEQMAIRKLTFIFLQHIVSYRVTPVLLSPANAPHLQLVLQSMNDGLSTVTDPAMKKTCIVFFRDLIDQWAGSDRGLADDGHQATLHVFLQYVFQNLVPGLFRIIVDPAFNERDALQARNIGEMGRLLSILKSKRGHEEFNLYVVDHALAGGLQGRADVVDSFRRANTGSEMEACLNQVIVAVKKR